MSRIYLVRHAKPAAAWGGDADPGLDPIGVTQATQAAQDLAKMTAPVPVYTSPARRCRETALPLCELWRCDVVVLPAVAEIPAPPLDAAARREWLAAGLRSTWREFQDRSPPGSTDYLRWRKSVVDALLALPHDCVIYTHFVAINVAAGAAQQREEVTCFKPDHASVTVLEAGAGGLRLIELGREASTIVLTR